MLTEPKMWDLIYPKKSDVHKTDVKEILYIHIIPSQLTGSGWPFLKLSQVR